MAPLAVTPTERRRTSRCDAPSPSQWQCGTQAPRPGRLASDALRLASTLLVGDRDAEHSLRQWQPDSDSESELHRDGGSGILMRVSCLVGLGAGRDVDVTS